MYDIIIIGAGPAGLTAAIYAARAAKKVLLLEEKSYGGQIIDTPSVDNYPGIIDMSGFDFAHNLLIQAQKFGASIKYEQVLEFLDDTTIKTNKGEYTAKAFILATGLKRKKLGLINEDAFIGRGISYCAICDGNFFRGMDVAVVGGGNSAVEDALYLANIVKKVYLIHRRDEFRAEKFLLNELKKHSNVEILLNSEVENINGKENLEDILVVNTENGEKKKLNVRALFIAIGLEAHSQFMEDIIDIDENGFFVSHDCRTNKENIFVAGDCRTKDLRQLTTATADGAVAATYAIEYLNSHK